MAKYPAIQLASLTHSRFLPAERSLCSERLETVHYPSVKLWHALDVGMAVTLAEQFRYNIAWHLNFHKLSPSQFKHDAKFHPKP